MNLKNKLIFGLASLVLITYISIAVIGYIAIAVIGVYGLKHFINKILSLRK